MSFRGLVRIGGTCPFGILLVGLGVDLVHSVQADAHVLPRVDKLNELLYGTIDLSDYILHCQHHTERHAAMYHGCGGKNGNENVLYLVDGDASCLLYLLKIKGLQINLEQVCLHILPFPAFSLLTSLQFDFLHATNELVGDVAIAACLLEVFVIKLSAFFKKEDNPTCVKQCSQKEDKKYAKIIDGKDDTKDKECEERE